MKLKSLFLLSLMAVVFTCNAQKRNPCESDIGIVATFSGGVSKQYVPFNLELTAWWPYKGVVAGAGVGNYKAEDGEKTGYDSKLLPYATVGARVYQTGVFKTYLFGKINTALSPTISLRQYVQFDFIMVGLEGFLGRANVGGNVLITFRLN